MFGPHGTSAQPTFTPFATACLIVGVSGPPSFGPMNQAWYLFETSASRSWFTWTFVVNFASNTVSLTLGYLAATFFAPSSSASQYVLAAEARNTAMLIVPALLLPDAVDPSVAALASMTTERTPATSAFLIPWPPCGFRIPPGVRDTRCGEPKGRAGTSQPRPPGASDNSTP